MKRLICNAIFVCLLVNVCIVNNLSVAKNATKNQNSNLVIPKALNFQSDLSDQQRTQRIILLYVSAPDCAFCKKLEKEVLFPLLQSGDYTDKIILRKIDWHGDKNVSAQ